MKSPYTVKADLSKEARDIELRLLKVWWSLIQDNTPKLDIKIHGNKIYIKGKLHGQADSTGFRPATALSNSNTPASAISSTSMDTATSTGSSSAWLGVLRPQVCVQNCRSLVKNLSQFQSFVYASDFQIIGLSETWLSDNIADLEILPQAYSLYRKDRGSRGGGDMLAVSNKLPSRQVLSPHNLEVVSVSIFLSNTDITSYMVYAPLNASAEYHSDLVNYLNTITALSTPVLLLGDFNTPDINWSTLTGSSTAWNNLCEFAFESNLVQLVDSPTHICGNIGFN